MASHNELGKWGEETATIYLRQKGYTILERDWKSGHRDIDIIATINNTIVFIEVKTRKFNSLTSPIEAVNYQKLKNLKRSINHYVKSKRIDLEIRFDVITVSPTPSGKPEIKEGGLLLSRIALQYHRRKRA